MMLKKSASTLKRAGGEDDWFVLFVWLNLSNQKNKINQTNQIGPVTEPCTNQ
jgi:hypothetical protein